MENLFSVFKINSLTLKNRSVMSAAADNLNNNPEARLKRFATLAQGQIGLIISGGTRPHVIEKWRDVIDVVHKNGGKFAIQLVVESGPGVFMGQAQDDKNSIAVSVLSEDSIYFKALTPFVSYGKHHEATEQELLEIINTYAKAAALAQEIGADAIQVHAAHQNFLSQMLSPLTNTRTDKWGGSIENRTRLHLEVYKAIRKRVGKDFPILIKLGLEDAVQGGLKFTEGKKAAKLIADYGYNAIEVSQGLQNYTDWNGTPMRTINTEKDEAYFQDWCREIKQIISTPTILTGGVRSPKLIEQLIKNGTTDCVGMCRPFIREPGLIKRWQDGDLSKATCISCNKCLTEIFLKGEPLACYLDAGIKA